MQFSRIIFRAFELLSLYYVSLMPCDGLRRLPTSSGRVRGLCTRTTMSVRRILPSVQRGPPSSVVQRLEETASVASALPGPVRRVLADGLGSSGPRIKHRATTNTNLSSYPGA